MNVEEERKRRETKYEEKKNKENKSEYMNVLINIAVMYIESVKVYQTYSLHSGLYFFHFFCILRLQAATSKNNIMTTTTTNIIRIGTASF